jgi:hypothetical protein
MKCRTMAGEFTHRAGEFTHRAGEFTHITIACAIPASRIIFVKNMQLLAPQFNFLQLLQIVKCKDSWSGGGGGLWHIILVDFQGSIPQKRLKHSKYLGVCGAYL